MRHLMILLLLLGACKKGFSTDEDPKDGVRYVCIRGACAVMSVTPPENNVR